LNCHVFVFLIVLYTVINFGTKLVENMEFIALDNHVIEHNYSTLKFVEVVCFLGLIDLTRTIIS